MRPLLTFTVGLLLLCGSAFAFENDKDAAQLEKEVRKVNKVASVSAGRRVVNQIVSDQLGVPREQLVAERRKTGLAYGQLFAVHEIANESFLFGFDDLAIEFKNGRTLVELARKYEVDPKSVLDETKRLNKEIAKTLADGGDEGGRATDTSGSGAYNPSFDSQPADTSGMTPQDLSKNDTYVRSQGAAHANPGAQGIGLGRSGSTAPGASGGFGGMGSPANSGSAHGGAHRGPGM